MSLSLRRLFPVSLMLFCAVGLSACFGRYSWHQKLTVTVMTPSGLVSASAVTAVRWWDSFKLGGLVGGASKHFWLKGEAVAVDLGQGRYLFALLRPGPSAGGETIADLATQVVTGKPNRQWSTAAFEAVHDLPRPAVVPPLLYPLLVTFDDINDPASVKKVDPYDPDTALGCEKQGGSKPWVEEGMEWARWHRRNTVRQWALEAGRDIGIEPALAATMLKGEGDYLFRLEDLLRNEFPKSDKEIAGFRKHYTHEQARRWQQAFWERFSQSELESPAPPPQSTCYAIQSITLEITNEPVTTGKIEKVLGWLGQYNDWLQIAKDSTVHSSYIGDSDFDTEVFK